KTGNVSGEPGLFMYTFMHGEHSIRPAPSKPVQCLQQRLVLLWRADGDAQELVDPRLLEVPHYHPLLTQTGRQLGCIALRMAGKDEVRRRRQDLEAQRLQSADHFLATGDHRLTGLLEPLAILERRRRADNRQAVQRVGVEAVLDSLQRLDQ